MRICNEVGSGFKCSEPAETGFAKCKWHLEARRVHQAADRKFNRHIRLVGTSTDLERLAGQLEHGEEDCDGYGVG